MAKAPLSLLVDMRELPTLRVIHSYCLFRSEIGNPDKVIRPAFGNLHLRLSGLSLDPDTLLHVGVPEVVDGHLVSYDCCVEFPLPDDASGVQVLPGGRYVVLTVEKNPRKTSLPFVHSEGTISSIMGLSWMKNVPLMSITSQILWNSASLFGRNASRKMSIPSRRETKGVRKSLSALLFIPYGLSVTRNQ